MWIPKYQNKNQHERITKYKIFRILKEILLISERITKKKRYLGIMIHTSQMNLQVYSFCTKFSNFWIVSPLILQPRPSPEHCMYELIRVWDMRHVPCTYNCVNMKNAPLIRGCVWCLFYSVGAFFCVSFCLFLVIIVPNRNSCRFFGHTMTNFIIL